MFGMIKINLIFLCKSNAINHETNPDKAIPFYNLEHQKLEYILTNENYTCFCCVVKAQMIQCKYMISFNNFLNLRLIGK